MDKIASAKIRLLKQVKRNQTWAKRPVVVGKDGKHKLSRVFVDGVEQEHPNGVYHLDYRVGPVRRRVTVRRFWKQPVVWDSTPPISGRK